MFGIFIFSFFCRLKFSSYDGEIMYLDGFIWNDGKILRSMVLVGCIFKI